MIIRIGKVLVFSILAPLLLISCHKKERTTNNPPPSTSCTATTNISYGGSCTTGSGCTLSFTCPLQQASSVSKFFNTMIKKLPPFQATTEQLTITSITTVDEPALLQSTPGLVSESWYSTSTPATLQCTNDNGQISCSEFGPVGSKFDLIGTLSDLAVTVHVTVVNDVSPIATNAEDLIGGCGQFGTTYQRIFDCSERVTNFAGIGQGGGASTPFTLGDPDPNWFLVACPVFTGTTIGTDTTSQQCSWLSPVIQTGNPSIGINRNPPNTGTQDTTSPDIGPGGATRLLWSGSLNNSATYNFWQANGTNSSGNANCNGSGQCAQYNQGSSPTYTFNTFISTDTTTPAATDNACVSALNVTDNAFSGMTTFSWILPSYPIMLTITGGSSCSFGTTNANCNGQGFSSISKPIPNFLSDGSDASYLWSSSVFDSSNGWEFEGLDGDVNDRDLSLLNGVRCVSAAW